MSAPAWRVIALVSGREIHQRARSRAFVVVTLILAVGVALLATLPALSAASLDLGGRDADATVVVGVLGVEIAALDPVVASALDAVGDDVQLVEVGDREAAATALERGDLAFAYDPVAPGGPQVLTASPSNPFAPDIPGSVLDTLGRAGVASDAGLDGTLLDDLLRPPRPEVEVVTSGAPRDPAQASARFGIAYVGAVLLYFFLVFSANLIVTGVVEEKGSRIVELLLPAVPARQLMAGKILGLGAVGVLQALVIVLPGATVVALGGAGPPMSTLLGAVAAVLIAFVLGFGLYAGVTAGLSSLVSRIEDSQVALLPLYAALVAAFLLTLPVLSAPNSVLAQVATFVPFTAPFVVPARVVLVDVPGWQVALSALGVVVTGVVLTAVAARLYEGSILRAGGRVRIGQALRDRDR